MTRDELAQIIEARDAVEAAAETLHAMVIVACRTGDPLADPLQEWYTMADDTVRSIEEELQ